MSIRSALGSFLATLFGLPGTLYHVPHGPLQRRVADLFDKRNTPTTPNCTFCFHQTCAKFSRNSEWAGRWLYSEVKAVGGLTLQQRSIQEATFNTSRSSPVGSCEKENTHTNNTKKTPTHFSFLTHLTQFIFRHLVIIHFWLTSMVESLAFIIFVNSKYTNMN